MDIQAEEDRQRRIQREIAKTTFSVVLSLNCFMMRNLQSVMNDMTN